jgi:hypothetical protein
LCVLFSAELYFKLPQFFEDNAKIISSLMNKSCAKEASFALLYESLDIFLDTV